MRVSKLLPDSEARHRLAGSWSQSYYGKHPIGPCGIHFGEGAMDGLDKFTDGARQVMSLAEAEARRFDYNYIGTEHLLLGLVREHDGVAGKVLTSLGFDLTNLRSAIEFIIGRGDSTVIGEIGLTPRAKKVIQLAVDEARQLRRDHVDTEHLLLGLTREGQGIAAGILSQRGRSLNDVREKVMDRLRGDNSG
jgi:ATP-dependent Clp protease ATP-binding subunit ClpC